MLVYKLEKFNSISAEMASVHMICDKGSTDIALPRTQCSIGRNYANIKGNWRKLSKYRAKIKKINFQNDKSGFIIAQINILENYTKDDIPTDVPRIKGFFSVVYEEEEVDMLGYWDSSNKGLYFWVINYERVLKIEAVAIKNYLKAAMPNVSSIMITNIIKQFGADNVINIIKNSPNELLKVKGVGPKAVIRISDGIAQACILENVFEFMTRFDIPTSAIISIYKEFGLASEKLIKTNPYKIAESFLLTIAEADKIGEFIGLKYDNPGRIKALITYFLKNESENKGDMFSYFRDIVMNLTDFSNKVGYLKHKESFSEQEIFQSLSALEKEKVIYIENHPIDGYCVYHSYYKTVEDKICYRLEELIHTINSRKYFKDKTNKLIEEQEKKYSIKIAPEQKNAIHMAMKNKFSILTGGPGTGKTQTINSIIKIMEELYPDISIGLCAPTGKASKRMSELTGKEAYTIHKKLKCTPFTAADELDMIDSDVLIVDEASMIDADLFYKLLISVKDDATILLVGDYHQLPSVGVGLILRDLIESGVVQTTELTQVFRQKGTSPIIELAQSISKGEHIEEGSRFLEDNDDYKFIIRKDNISIQNQILKTIDSAVKSKTINPNDIQVLMPINHGDIGMVILNQKIQGLLNPDVGQNKYELSPFMELREGDRVMQTKNNYDIGVFNGSVGYIKKIIYSDDIEMTCEFDGETKTYKGFESVEELILAYAITIHKSQGSEFPLVIMPLSKSYGQILSRNLIYTGITRAKKYLRLIGDIDAFNFAVDKTDIVSRNSHIKEKLQKILV